MIFGLVNENNKFLSSRLPLAPVSSGVADLPTVYNSTDYMRIKQEILARAEFKIIQVCHLDYFVNNVPS